MCSEGELLAHFSTDSSHAGRALKLWQRITVESLTALCARVCVYVWTAASTALAAVGYLSTGLNATCDWGCILTGLCKRSGRVYALRADKDGCTWFTGGMLSYWCSFPNRLSHSCTETSVTTNFGPCVCTPVLVHAHFFFI